MGVGFTIGAGPVERMGRVVSPLVGISSNRGAITRVVRSALAEQHEELQVSQRYLTAESLAKLYQEAEPELMTVLLLAS